MSSQKPSPWEPRPDAPVNCWSRLRVLADWWADMFEKPRLVKHDNGIWQVWNKYAELNIYIYEYREKTENKSMALRIFWKFFDFFINSYFLCALLFILDIGLSVFFVKFYNYGNGNYIMFALSPILVSMKAVGKYLFIINFVLGFMLFLILILHISTYLFVFFAKNGN